VSTADTLEERGLEPMQQMLDATGGWPILMSEEEKNAKEITWQKMDNDYLQLYTFSILFNISYTINDGNSILMVYLSIYITHILVYVYIFACVRGYMCVLMCDKLLVTTTI